MTHRKRLKKVKQTFRFQKVEDDEELDDSCAWIQPPGGLIHGTVLSVVHGNVITDGNWSS